MNELKPYQFYSRMATNKHHILSKGTCDPHQRWADEGWGDVPEPSACGDCGYFEPSPFLNGEGGVCILATEVTRNRVHVEWRRDTDSCEEFSE